MHRLSVFIIYLLALLPLAGSARNLLGRWPAHTPQTIDATELSFHFQHRYAVAQKDRKRLLTRIIEVLDEGRILGPLPYISYTRASDHAIVFATDFRNSADSVACLITVDPSAERDRYVIFSVSTAIKPHLLTDRLNGTEREQESEHSAAKAIAIAIFQGLSRDY